MFGWGILKRVPELFILKSRNWRLEGRSLGYFTFTRWIIRVGGWIFLLRLLGFKPLIRN